MIEINDSESTKKEVYDMLSQYEKHNEHGTPNIDNNQSIEKF